MCTCWILVIIIVCPQSQETNVWIIWMGVALQAGRPGGVTLRWDAIGPAPFGWRGPRWGRGHAMMRTPRAGRWWWVTVPGWMARPSWWSSRRRRGGTPSKPLSHAGTGGPTRGSRATPVPTVRWRRMWWITTTTVTWGVRWPRAARTCRPLPTLEWAAVIGHLASVAAWAFGRRRPMSRRGGWVRWHRRTSDPCPISIHRWPFAGSTVSTRVTASSFWTRLMLSPWRLSVVRGTQLPQCVGAHVLVRNSGTHSWLRWRGEVFFRVIEGVAGGGTAVGPTSEGPRGGAAGPGRPERPVVDVSGCGPRTLVTATTEPRPGHTQGAGGLT